MFIFSAFSAKKNIALMGFISALTKVFQNITDI
jgi:hypothetical protein